MRKQEIGNVVSILLKYHEENTIDGRVNFMSFLEGLCDSESSSYFLWDLDTLANALRDQNAPYLIDEIAKYDYQAAQQLNVLYDK
ncbi:hypothetical protein QNH39_13180 [Neobacillus novalis]|uniref:Uncharacterized protein n=1 Tax=Neobacillus novalis TaxID=220687 RepID=A0AA95SDE1_9BACI|nr:hypothetical protein [Neobacillus novalis]WHY88724.1 hypothetical protein QNH39_13180 [Neobacillus novalis]